MWWIIFIQFLITYDTMVDCEETGKRLSRQKRFLLYPGTFDFIQLVIGAGVPVEVDPEVALLGWSFRALYELPRNLSKLTPMDYGATSRKKRHLTRWDFYKMLSYDSLGPTSTNEEIDHHTDNEYYAAQKLGKKYRGKCKQLFPECTTSWMDMITHSSFNDT
ncbi:uncharacterized protein isoform X2 [Leptinotarsa decemlineata]|uniref:uncharacterized protein isoform X2 n=1 Tax=Leptinotarsa decemlineata TaxID=7539 RepID=UPI003D30B9B3